MSKCLRGDLTNVVIFGVFLATISGGIEVVSRVLEIDSEKYAKVYALQKESLPLRVTVSSMMADGNISEKEANVFFARADQEGVWKSAIKKSM